MSHSGQTNRKAFDLLCLARVLHKIPSATPAGLPLGATANEKRFKAAFVDVGLMQRLCGLPVDREMQHRNLLDIYRGKLAEQFVAQELIVAQDRERVLWGPRGTRQLGGSRLPHRARGADPSRRGEVGNRRAAPEPAPSVGRLSRLRRRLGALGRALRPATRVTHRVHSPVLRRDSGDTKLTCRAECPDRGRWMTRTLAP